MMIALGSSVWGVRMGQDHMPQWQARRGESPLSLAETTT